MKTYTQDQIREAFKEWESRYQSDPSSFEEIEESIDEKAKLKAEYLVELIEENEKLVNA